MAQYNRNTQTNPDYPRLVRFLLEPFLNVPHALKIDCEYLNDRSRVWMRLAIAEEDKARALGRGNRHLSAIRAILNAAAASISQSVHVEIFGGIPVVADNYPPREGGFERTQRNFRGGGYPTRARSEGGDRFPRGGGDRRYDYPLPERRERFPSRRGDRPPFEEGSGGDGYDGGPRFHRRRRGRPLE
jgi:predicted RNA-binding protein YlqC (UPF0109 family)